MDKGSKRASIASVKSGVRVTREDTACTCAGGGDWGGFLKLLTFLDQFGKPEGKQGYTGD